MKKVFSILVLMALLSPFAFAQKPSHNRDVIVKRTLSITDADPLMATYQCNYELLVPTNIFGKQEIIEYKFPGIKPHHFNKNPDNEYYLVWQNINFIQLQTTGLQVDIKLKLHTYDLQTAKLHPLKDTANPDTARYLKNEENFNTKAKNIKEAAEQITGTDREEIVKAIFNYTTKSLDYHIYYYQDRGAKQALKDGRGDCTEYSELMVTLCRVKKIPARIVMGLIPQSSGKVGRHNWVEVYFPKYGWVAFDPTWADSPTATTSFYKMKNTYVQLSYKRYIKTVINSCTDMGYAVTGLRLRDTSVDLTQGITKKINTMHTYYEKFELQKANAMLDTLLNLEPDNSNFLALKGMVNARMANFDTAYHYIQNAIKNSETAFDKVNAVYSLSNYYALKPQPDSAVVYLQKAVDLGLKSYKQVATDTDFYRIKTYPSFVKIVDALKQQAEKATQKK